MFVKKNKVQDQNKKNAIILLIIVTIFIVSQSLCVALNMHEISVLDEIDWCAETELGGFPAWIIFTGFLSEIALVINSSSIFLIYCLVGTKIKLAGRGSLSFCFKGRNQEDTELKMKSIVWMTDGNSGLEQ